MEWGAFGGVSGLGFVHFCFGLIVFSLRNLLSLLSNQKEGREKHYRVDVLTFCHKL